MFFQDRNISLSLTDVPVVTSATLTTGLICNSLHYTSTQTSTALNCFFTLFTLFLGHPVDVTKETFYMTYLAIWLLLFKQRRMQLTQSKDGSFVERVARNNSRNNGDHHKIYEIFLINCFVFVITVV